MATRIIKDVYTEYLSGSVVVTPPPSNRSLKPKLNKPSA